MRQYISNEKYELIKDNLDSKDTYVIVDGENVDKVAFRTNNITGQNAMYEIIPGALPTGTYNITENGEYDVAAYASAYVDVSSEWEENYNSLFNDTITYLDSSYIPSGSTNLRSYIFYGCAGITYVNLPNVTNIGREAFNSCSNLTSVNLPSIVSLGSQSGGDTFCKCSKLTTVDLGPNVTNIMTGTFTDCNALTSFTCRAITPPTIGQWIFGYWSQPANLVIYVPAESVDTYKTASGWIDYADKIQAIVE